MKIALIGAGGNIGQRIAQEAVSRGHEVIGIQREPAKITTPNVKAVRGDLNDVASIVEAIRGADVVVSSTAPADGESYVRLNRNLLEAVRQAGVPRLLVVGGAGSMPVAPGGPELLDTGALDPFPWKWVAEAGRALRNLLRDEAKGLNWTFFAPAGEIGPGERTGKFRTSETLIMDEAAGKSHVSYEDYAVAMLDEVEQPQFAGRQFTVGY